MKEGENAMERHINTPDIYQATVKYIIPDEGYARAIDIVYVAACSGGEAYNRIEDYYGDELISAEIMPICENRGLHHIGYMEDESVIKEMYDEHKDAIKICEY